MDDIKRSSDMPLKFSRCKLCLAYDFDLIDVFQNNERLDFQLPMAIQELLNVEISDEDFVPWLICRICLRKLKEFSEFKQRAIKNIKLMEIMLLVYDSQSEEDDCSENSCDDEDDDDDDDDIQIIYDSNKKNESGFSGAIDQDKVHAVVTNSYMEDDSCTVVPREGKVEEEDSEDLCLHLESDSEEEVFKVPVIECFWSNNKQLMRESGGEGKLTRQNHRPLELSGNPDQGKVLKEDPDDPEVKLGGKARGVALAGGPTRQTQLRRKCRSLFARRSRSLSEYVVPNKRRRWISGSRHLSSSQNGNKSRKPHPGDGVKAPQEAVIHRNLRRKPQEARVSDMRRGRGRSALGHEDSGGIQARGRRREGSAPSRSDMSKREREEFGRRGTKTTGEGEPSEEPRESTRDVVHQSARVVIGKKKRKYYCSMSRGRRKVLINGKFNKLPKWLNLLSLEERATVRKLVGECQGRCRAMMINGRQESQEKETYQKIKDEYEQTRWGSKYPEGRKRDQQRKQSASLKRELKAMRFNYYGERWSRRQAAIRKRGNSVIRGH